MQCATDYLINQPVAQPQVIVSFMILSLALNPLRATTPIYMNVSFYLFYLHILILVPL